MRKSVLIIVVFAIIFTLASCDRKSVDTSTFGMGALKEDAISYEEIPTSPAETSTLNPAEPIKFNYDDYLPEVDFATLLFSFENPDENGKTYLYADANYSEVVEYVNELIDDGYDQVSKDASKKNDSYVSEFEDKDSSAVVSVTYEDSGLTISIEISKDE